MAAHYRNLHSAGVVRGTCLWLDFPFPTFHDNMGHWAEALLPIYSQLSDGDWRAAAAEPSAAAAGSSSSSSGGNTADAAADDAGFLSAAIFPNLRREQVLEVHWVMGMLRLALAPGVRGGAGLPRLLFMDDLEGLNATAWLGFERVLLVQNRCGGGGGGGRNGR